MALMGWNNRQFLFTPPQPKAKIEEDRPMLGSDRAGCLGLLGTLPKDKRSRVDDWFENGGTNGAYQYLEFLDYFKAVFEDKRGTPAAAKELTRMRQGNDRPFHEFVLQYEHKLIQCGGERWDPLMKIAHLNNGLNSELEKVLIGIDMPPLDNYFSWRNKAREVAEPLELHHNCAIAHGKKLSNLQQRTKPWMDKGPVKDSEGETFMTGVKALVTPMNRA